MVQHWHYLCNAHYSQCIFTWHPREDQIFCCDRISSDWWYSSCLQHIHQYRCCFCLHCCDRQRVFPWWKVSFLPFHASYCLLPTTIISFSPSFSLQHPDGVSSLLPTLHCRWTLFGSRPLRRPRGCCVHRIPGSGSVSAWWILDPVAMPHNLWPHLLPVDQAPHTWGDKAERGREQEEEQGREGERDKEATGICECASPWWRGCK